CGAHVAASGAGAASGAAAGARVAAGVTGVARTGIAGVRAARVAGVGAAGVSRLFLLLGALENHLGFGFGEDLLVLLLLLHLFAVDGLDLVDDLLRAVFAFGFDLGLTLVERIGLLGLDLGLDGLLILDRLVLDAVDGQHLAVGDFGGHRHGQEVVLLELDARFLERFLLGDLGGRDLVVLAVSNDGEFLRRGDVDVVALPLPPLVGLSVEIGTLRIDAEVGQRLTHGVRVVPFVGLLTVDGQRDLLRGVD